MSRHKQNEVLFSDDQNKPIIELARITYKSSGISLYLPKSIVNSLNLRPEEVSSLIMFSTTDYGFFLIKDAKLAEILKPQILDRRKALLEYLDKNYK